MNKNLTFGLCALALIVAGCAPSAASIGTAIAQTQAAIPTATPAPTATALPTASPTTVPSVTPVPSATNTPLPTNTNTPSYTTTPLPTSTSPLPTGTPQAFAGAGDSVIDLPSHCICVAHITGNKGSRFFSVSTLDANGQDVDLLVNTTDPYDGYRPVDFLDTQQSVRLKVTATGAWAIVLVSLSDFDRLRAIPGHIEGLGDDLVILDGTNPDLLTISGNADSRFFSVSSWSRTANDLLVNTTDPYSGTVPVSHDAVLLEITASGKWSIDVTTK